MLGLTDDCILDMYNNKNSSTKLPFKEENQIAIIGTIAMATLAIGAFVIHWVNIMNAQANTSLSNNQISDPIIYKSVDTLSIDPAQNWAPVISYISLPVVIINFACTSILTCINNKAIPIISHVFNGVVACALVNSFLTSSPEECAAYATVAMSLAFLNTICSAVYFSDAAREKQTHGIEV